MLECLDKWGLYIKVLKYTFNTKQIKFLNYIVTPTDIDNLRIARAKELL